MRISDCLSDVCSSALPSPLSPPRPAAPPSRTTSSCAPASLIGRGDAFGECVTVGEASDDCRDYAKRFSRIADTDRIETQQLCGIVVYTRKDGVAHEQHRIEQIGRAHV